MSWHEVLPDSNVWFYEYNYPNYKGDAIYKANAIAFPLNDRDLAVVSPPMGLSETDFAAIDLLGRVVALIAPHRGHLGGQGVWQDRYPDAIPYAPTAPGDIRTSVGRPLVPLSRLAARDTQFREAPCKSAEVIATVLRGDRPVVYLGELVFIWPALFGWPSAPTLRARLKFWLPAESRRLQINPVYRRSVGPDLPSVARTVLDALAGDPAIVLAHGAPLVRPGDASRVRALVEPLAKM